MMSDDPRLLTKMNPGWSSVPDVSMFSSDGRNMIYWFVKLLAGRRLLFREN